MTKSVSLVIFLPTLASGGVERLHINLAPFFIQAGYNVTFLLQRCEGSLVDEIPKGVRVVSLDCHRTLTCIQPLMRFLQRERPDFLVSNLGFDNIISLWARRAARATTRIIVCQHSALSAQKSIYKNAQSHILPILYRIFLGWADAIVSVSSGVARDLAEMTKIPLGRITTIYNPVILPNFDELMNEAVHHPWFAEKKIPVILGVGRLALQKDFITLIHAFARVTQKRNARLLLLGEGPERQTLATLVEKLGLNDHVDFLGFQRNPLPYMHRASLLVMSSRYEGFCNVLVEALGCGTPVVSTDCPYGPAEILDGGRYGRLVPVADPGSMAQAILDALDHPPTTEFLQARGHEFTVQRAANSYIQVFNTFSGD
jgi:glycosyltransferase involved in cell wall biosynthesis